MTINAADEDPETKEHSNVLQIVLTRECIGGSTWVIMLIKKIVSIHKSFKFHFY